MLTNYIDFEKSSFYHLTSPNIDLNLPFLIRTSISFPLDRPEDRKCYTTTLSIVVCVQKTVQISKEVVDIGKILTNATFSQRLTFKTSDKVVDSLHGC